jgi:hypothetical protein
MKRGIHPDYHPVVFQDPNTGTAFLTRSTIPALAPSSGQPSTGPAPIPWSSSRFPRRRTRFGPVRPSSGW